MLILKIKTVFFSFSPIDPWIYCLEATTLKATQNYINHLTNEAAKAQRVYLTWPWSQTMTELFCFFLFFLFFLSFFFFFFCFSFLATLWHMEFPGQGSAPSHTWDLHHTCSYVGILNPLCQTGDWTCVPALLRQCWSCCATAGYPKPFLPNHWGDPVWDV